MEIEELHIDPVKIIENKKRKEFKLNLFKASLLDAFLIFYSVLVLQRIIYYKFILQLKDAPFTWGEID